MHVHSEPPLVDETAITEWRRSAIVQLALRGIAESASRLASFESEIRRVSAILHQLYHSPYLGNYRDPTDEFVFIVLSRKTAERAFNPAFSRLKKVGSWEQILQMPTESIASIIRGCGLERWKAEAIRAELRRSRERFGHADLSQLAMLPPVEAYNFLLGLPHVGPKSALCVLMYSFMHPVFPVDTHVGRALSRLRCLHILGLDLINMNHKQRQREIPDVIPPDLRYALHVNPLSHGRTICKPKSPLCNRCVLKVDCEFGRLV